ncbi:MAG TPA: sodium:proton exchanger, partial [Wenzhouxiangella sp.]|nr:sodium:proton exchanger [Wenzhouxiangella sp.]
ARVDKASLVVLAVDLKITALAAVKYIRRNCPQVPVIVRAPDLRSRARLLAAGAAHAHPETLESSLQLGVTALEMLNVAPDDIEQILQAVRDRGYRTAAGE